MAYVLDVAEQAVKFKKIHGYARFVIDGMDLLLAKKVPNIFTDLVDRAKYLSHSGSLRLISVSKVMPLILSTTLHTRAAPVVEVVDISDEEAVRSSDAQRSCKSSCGSRQW